MKTIAATALFATVALAQSNLIPVGISSPCSAYLNKFNSDTSLSTCTSSLITATGAFAPSTNASASTTTPSAAQVKSALAAVCSASTCEASTIRSALADFYQACPDELSTGNRDVIRIYDVLYTITPLKNTICSKGDNSEYCVTDIASTISKSSTELSNVAKYVAQSSTASSALSRRADAAQVVASVTPNTTTFANNNLVFLLLQPELPKEKLCQTCTRNVITSYISFESDTPYAPGLSSSQLLAGQSALYQAVQNTCGSNFLSGAVAAAAGLSGGLVGQATDNGAAQMSLASTGVVGAVLGVVALVLGTGF
ncbi:hypothetical protein C8Q74DRAFT_1300986 [Fomes fomentarius]|nr:hypothetical protein C8Q74DRAFT_1300986 [Fomes fomentarius]